MVTLSNKKVCFVRSLHRSGSFSLFVRGSFAWLCVFFALNPSPQNGRNIFGGWLWRVASSTKKWVYIGSVHLVSKFSVAKMIKYLITKKIIKKYQSPRRLSSCVKAGSIIDLWCYHIRNMILYVTVLHPWNWLREELCFVMDGVTYMGLIVKTMW